MRKLLAIIVLLGGTFCCLAQQKKYSAEEVQRLASLGKVWGMLHYFHPNMGSGKIATDSLIIRNAASLAANPSAENFKTAMTDMLAQVHDPATRFKEKDTKDSSIIFSPSATTASIKKYGNGYWYIAMPTASCADDATVNMPGVLPAGWADAKGVIIDLRNSNNDDPYADYNFLRGGYKAILDSLSGGASLPWVYERSVYHNGFVSQDDGSGNIYYSGWRTSTSGGMPDPTNVNLENLSFKKPVAFVINEFTIDELVKIIQALRAAGKCRIICEGNLSGYPVGAVRAVSVADDEAVYLRTSDFLTGNGSAVHRPDLQQEIKTVADTATFLQQCFSLLDNWQSAGGGGTFNQSQHGSPAAAVTASFDYVLPRSAAYDQSQLVPLGHRLFALYNYWNAIHYFFPYKKLIGRDWDSVLLQYIPLLINANDTLSYNLALRSMVSEIHDCHGFFSNAKVVAPLRKAIGYWAPIEVSFIGDKLYVTDVAKDSLQKMDAIKVWDEIVTVDGLTIPQSLDKWKQFLSSSNESAFKRDIARYLLDGEQFSKVKLVINRNGKRESIELVRTGRSTEANNKRVDFNDDYDTMKMLPGNIGYVNMGKLGKDKVDSLFDTFMDTRAIVFDIRNYPKGTAWSIAPRLAEKEAKAVKFETPYVTADYIDGGEGAQIMTSYFTVLPNKTKPPYKGKVIVLCDEQTQSQAEYSIMMFQGATKTTVIGSQTAGADGNVTNVVLPGGYTTTFSGLGVLYPDGGQTQRSGIRVDIQVKPAVAGLKAGKDEVLERALRFINTGK
jgi:carboxyl-terminal processing protease